MAVLTPTPVVYVQKYVDRRVIPIYIHTSSDEDENDDDFLVSDDEDIEASTPKPTGQSYDTSPKVKCLR